MDVDNKFTCITCRVAFRDAELQRQHYKTDWHRYNLKRKVAELPPVNAEEFQRRVLLQREKDETEMVQKSLHCGLCRKAFGSQNAYDNHLNSKKHKSLLASAGDGEEGSGTMSERKDESEDSECEEVDSDEWEAEVGDNPIEKNDCLFCAHHSGSMLKNLRHMSEAHSFFVPDAEFVRDMRGLLLYLGEKVAHWYMCLWCNDRGRTFYSAEAARQHMTDKGHCKMLHEGEALVEYADYYDYSASYPDQGSDQDPDQEVDVEVLDDTDFQLVLPSGATIGHRSLMRYYRQHFDPSRAVVPQKKIHRVLAQYRALGWTETQKEQAARKARDIHFMRRVQSRLSTKLALKGNKLQKHFRPQVNF